MPLVVEKLINYIEMHGLYTEGIFRKSGSTNKIKELRQGLDTGMVKVRVGVNRVLSQPCLFVGSLKVGCPDLLPLLTSSPFPFLCQM